MTVGELMRALEAKNLTAGVPDGKEVLCGYTCDLLSWVMAHGEEGMAWITVQTHLNVIAVAALAEMACVILPEGISMEEESVRKATQEGLCVLSTPLTAYEACGRMAALGIPAHG